MKKKIDKWEKEMNESIKFEINSLKILHPRLNKHELHSIKRGMQIVWLSKFDLN